MTPLHSLLTALIRLLGLYFAMRALDNAAAPFFAMIMQASTMPNDVEFQLGNPWIMFLPMAAFYVILATMIFLTAPKLARVMIGSEADREAEVPWHETLMFCTGGLIIAWAFVRLTDTIYGLAVGHSRIGNALFIYLLMTVFLLGAGVLLIMKLHRITEWIGARRTNSEQDGAHQPATRADSQVK